MNPQTSLQTTIQHYRNEHIIGMQADDQRRILANVLKNVLKHLQLTERDEVSYEARLMLMKAKELHTYHLEEVEAGIAGTSSLEKRGNVAVFNTGSVIKDICALEGELSHLYATILQQRSKDQQQDGWYETIARHYYAQRALMRWIEVYCMSEL